MKGSMRKGFALFGFAAALLAGSNAAVEAG